jgi:hypothetical protein
MDGEESTVKSDSFARDIFSGLEFSTAPRDFNTDPIKLFYCNVLG